MIRRCLAKDAEERWQTARDLTLELKWITEAGAKAGSAGSESHGKKSREWIAWVAALLLTAALAVSLLLSWSKRPAIAAPVRFQIPLPAGSANFSLSPNGRELAIVAPGADRRNAVWVRAIDSLETRLLPGTENVIGPLAFWSPDSRFVAFQAGTQLKKIDISGGPPQAICDISAVVLGGDWNRNDIIIVGTTGNGIMQVPAVGGIPTLVTTTGKRNEIHAFPSFLSDGRHFIYLRAPENSGIYAGSLDVKPEQQNSTRILATALMAGYAPSEDGDRGRMLFMREGSLLTQAFDEGRLEMLGEPVPVAEQVGTFLLSANFSVSASGVLAYRAGKTAIPLSHLEWYDRQGKELDTDGNLGNFSDSDLALSPDGKRVAATRIDPKAPSPSQRIWLLDLVRGVSVPFTFDLSPDSSPIWSPDGAEVAFAAIRKGGTGIYGRSANGAGKELTLLAPTDNPKYPNDWSHDGRYLLYTEENPRTHADLWVLPLAGDGTAGGAPTQVEGAEFDEGQGQFSPDMHWIAYASDETGRPEIYVQPFTIPPGGGGKTRVSRDGGTQPRWRRDGKELFYLSLDGKLTAVDVSEKPLFKVGVPRPLFQVPVSGVGAEALQDIFQLDVSADGNRFLIDATKTSSEPLTMVLNWTAGLTKK